MASDIGSLVQAVIEGNVAAIEAALAFADASNASALTAGILQQNNGIKAVEKHLENDNIDILRPLITHLFTPAARIGVGAEARPLAVAAAMAGARHTLELLRARRFFSASTSLAVWRAVAATASDASASAAAGHVRTLVWLIDVGCCPAAIEGEYVLRSLIDLAFNLPARLVDELFAACAHNRAVAALVAGGDAISGLEPLAGAIAYRASDYPRAGEAAVRSLWKTGLATLASPSLAALLGPNAKSFAKEHSVPSGIVKRVIRDAKSVQKLCSAVNQLTASQFTKGRTELAAALNDHMHWVLTPGPNGISAAMLCAACFGLLPADSPAFDLLQRATALAASPAGAAHVPPPTIATQVMSGVERVMALSAGDSDEISDAAPADDAPPEPELPTQPVGLGAALSPVARSHHQQDEAELEGDSSDMPPERSMPQPAPAVPTSAEQPRAPEDDLVEPKPEAEATPEPEAEATPEPEAEATPEPEAEPASEDEFVDAEAAQSPSSEDFEDVDDEEAL